MTMFFNEAEQSLKRSEESDQVSGTFLRMMQPRKTV